MRSCMSRHKREREQEDPSPRDTLRAKAARRQPFVDSMGVLVLRCAAHVAHAKRRALLPSGIRR